MTRERARRAHRFVPLGVVAALLTVACSASPSLEDYIASMERHTDAYVDESQSLSFEYQSAVEDGVRRIVAEGGADPTGEALMLVTSQTVQYLALLGDAMDRYHTAIEPLVPTKEVVADHDAYAAAVGSVVSSLPPTRTAVEAATSISEVQLALASSGFADGQLRWTATCSTLEQTVRDQGRGIDLRCVVPVADP
ncbi:MAG TPA: hypothetical protein VLA29_08705 [Acidimicrobiia bacterium]|nr:hypothetical protein [Acidimicrobiia bacterium]